jgi:CubicO group peptidase (beta-lactamase class C family)
MNKTFSRGILCLVLFLFSINAFSQDWVSRHAMTPAGYQTEFNNWFARGYRLTSLSGYTKNGQELYTAIWNKKSGPAWAAKHSMSAADYQAAFTDFYNKGYRLTCISGYAVGGQPKFAAIWEKTSGPAWAAKHNMTAAQYQQAFTNFSNQGYRIKYVSGYVVNGTEYFAAIWDKGAGGALQARHNMNATQYQQAFTDFLNQGYTLKMVSGYQKGNTDLYAAIWEKGNGPLWFARHGIAGNFYQGIFDNMYYQGYVPVYVNAFASGAGNKHNVIWQNTSIKASDLSILDNAANGYMHTQGITGMSIAVTKNGRLVFAKGYGYADPNAKEEMSPDHSLRIMSISKGLTAVGIMKLMEQNKISTSKHVFGPNSILGSKYATPADKQDLNKITVNMLLHHNSGIRTCNGEPEFWDKNKNHDDAMKMLLASSDLLKYPPNTQNEYSNTGYFILMCCIEELSGQTYETYIRNNVLTPSGVGSSMYVGNADGSIRNGESHYDPHESPNMNQWAGFGGWVARPMDLVKYLARVDGDGSVADILKTASHDTLVATTPLSPGYGCGWIVSGNLQSHNGAHSPSRSWLAEIGNGLSFAVIVNSAPSNDPGGHGKMLNELSTAIKAVSAFPGYDLF